jgi:mannose-1-phosphate guanylyltransferase
MALNSVPNVAVIMSGGRGRRFWPLSRAARAKQLIKLIDNKTLLELTLERLTPVFDNDRIMIVTQAIQAEQTHQVADDYKGIRVLSEPIGKNTAACVAYAASFVKATMGDAILTLLPADHFIRDAKGFRRLLKAGAKFVGDAGGILTLGIEPERPATGFGYIRVGKEVKTADGYTFFKVSQFTEKPGLDDARAYLDAGDYLWNAGIFLFRASTILDEIGEHLPEMSREFEKWVSAYGTPREADCLAQCYSNIEEISIDFGIIEKTESAYVVPADIGWDDVGNWESFSKYMPADEAGNRVHGKHVGIDSENCIIYSDEHLVATLGLKGFTVVATGDAILIAMGDRGEEVKRLVDLVEGKGLTDLL